MTITRRVEQDMTDYPLLATPRTTASEALESMDRTQVRHLPVVEDGKIVGVVSDRDLRQVELVADSAEILVADVMTRDPYCVAVGTPLSEVAAQMARRKYGCTVVLNRQGSVVGIFTTTDGMRLLSELLASDESADIRNWGIERLLTPTAYAVQ
jgi:acetoin utilization protein AcuB